MKPPEINRERRSDFAALLLFFILAILFFAPVLTGGRTLLPFDNLYRFPPWQSFAGAFGVTQPHNTLLDDLVLENYPWKKFIVDSLKQGELPLWNPYILSGQPFMAAGQNAALYPLSILFYILPLTLAYGIFTALHFWIAAAAMYLFGRVLGLRPVAATLSGIVYAFSGMMVVSVVFPMVISAAAWLPAILALLELALRSTENRNKLLYSLLAIILIGIQFLAGHVEISYYNLMVIGMYAAWRILPRLARRGAWGDKLQAAGRSLLLVGVIVGIGAALAAVQLVPLYELVQRNFREGSTTLDQVRGWALPVRQVLTFIIPDFFGNPAHHAYLDVFDWATKPAPNGTIFWGIKNYVEAGSYVGILPLVLALIASITSIAYYVRRKRNSELVIGNYRSPISNSVFFTLLAVLSLLFAFGTPLYAVLFYLLPGYNQLHTAFRWIFPYTLSIAMLSGVGLQVLLTLTSPPSPPRKAGRGEKRNSGGLATPEPPRAVRGSPPDSPLDERREGSETPHSPGQQEISASPAPGKQEESTVLSPSKQEESASLSPGKQENSASLSPGKQEESTALSPGKQENSASLSPGKQEESTALSPGKQENSASPSFRQVQARIGQAWPQASGGLGATSPQDYNVSPSPQGGEGQGWGGARQLGLLAWALMAAGLLGAAELGLSLVLPAPFLRLSDWVVAHDLAQPVFETGRVFWSYEFRPLFLFSLFLFGAGLVLRLTRSRVNLPPRLGGGPLWLLVALGIVVLDLFLAGFDFNPAADSRLVQFTPPAIKFLQADTSLYRITTYDLGEQAVKDPATGADKTIPPQRILNANAGMYFGISDIRGYDSIIPKQYVEFMRALAPQEELLYNRIAPLYSYQPLSSPLLNLLNVKYVLTTRPVPNPGYKLVYDGELKIYENLNVLPRAFMVSQARIIPDKGEMLNALPALDPAREVLLDAPAPLPGDAAATISATTEITKYTGSEVQVRTNSAQAGYLVLADSYFPGWVAQVDGQDTTVLRADYNFRAVVVPAGEHTVRFKYSPLSLRVGAVGSLVAGVIILLGFIILVWQQFFGLQLTGEGAQVRVIAKNSIVPMVSSFIVQGINFAFAIVMLRVLGPENVGRYTFAVTVWFFLSSITDFGLGILMTREVSRDKSLAQRYLTNTAVLRTLLTLATVLPLALIIGLYYKFSHLTFETVMTVALLWVSLIPTNLSASLSYLFNAHERFEYPTAVSLGTVLLSITLQLAALLAGYGIVGLAAVSIISNLFTLGVMYYLVRTILFSPRWEPDYKLMRWMFFESYPLMLNNLLANLFFKIDVLLLQPLTNDLVLGYYSTAYKFINALNFIPSNFTLAIFPMLSRQAANAKDAMYRALVVSCKLLLWVSLPITIATVFIAREVIQLYGGSAYLPDSQIALQWLIWFLPFSFVNSVVHYVLIALDQQRFLTKAFLIGLAFNLAANLTAIPLLSYRGAALVTVLSEVALLIPFYYSLRKHLAPLPILDLLWRPVVASAGMAAALYLLLPRINFFGALSLASLIYGAALLFLGALGPDEWLIARKLVPARLGRVVDFLARATG